MSATPSPYWRSVAVEVGAPVEGLAFIYDVCDDVCKDRKSGAVRHRSAAEYCAAFIKRAKDTYGEDYCIALKSWNFDSSEKLGRVFYALIDRGLMGRQDSDTQNDFDGLFDLSHIPTSSTAPVTYQPREGNITRRFDPSKLKIRHLFVLGAVTVGLAILVGILSELFPLVPTEMFLLAFMFFAAIFFSHLQNPIRYSLRTLLIVMTFLAVVLGSIALKMS